MLDIGANDQHLALALDPKSIRSARVIVPLESNFGIHVSDTAEMFARIYDFEKLKLGAHPVQLHGKVLGLHRDLENMPQVANALVLIGGENGDLLVRIVGRAEKGEALDMIPVKVRKRDNDIFLVMSDRAQVAAEIAQPGSGVNNRDPVRIPDRKLETGGVTAELLKARVADRDGAAGPVEF